MTTQTSSVSNWQPQNKLITMTAAAIKHVKQQLKKQGHGVGLRFGIRKSGCSGYAYDVQLLDAVDEAQDTVYPIAEGVLLAVNLQHLPMLQGTEIDYVQDGVNRRFQFNNPNETASCGCGESFAVKTIQQ